MLRIFVCNDHPTLYLYGGPAVILAKSPEEARQLLVSRLRETLGSKGDDEYWETVYMPIEEISNLDTPQVLSVWDGDY